MASPNTVRVAVTQLASVDFDLEAGVEKTCNIIAEASQAGAQLVAFPENFIPGYPFWIWYEFISLRFSLSAARLKILTTKTGPEPLTMT